jgi:hypothetical protein
MCDICDHNYRKLFGASALKNAVWVGGQYSPASYFNCEHTEEQKEYFKDVVGRRLESALKRAGREVL